jgi:hypothetical protein
MRIFKNQSGVALPLALIALVALTAFVAVFLGLGSTETQVGQNHSQLTGARYVAEAGIEWAFDQLIQRVAQDPNASFRAVVNTILGPPNNGVMASNLLLPGLTAMSGTFSVTLRNDSQANDNQITGQPVDPDPTTDTNDVIILTATGTFNGVTRQIQQVVTHLDLNISGGVNLPGVGSNTSFSGNSFTVSGRDTNLDDTAGACAPVWGIGVADAATESRVQSSLSQQQKDNVTGKPQSGGPGLGDNTIAPDLSLTPAQIAKFVNTVKPYADMSLQASGSNRLQYTNIGNTCGANLGDPNCWGTRSNPKIVYMKGSLDPGQAFYALSLSGTSTGAGILIIEDGDLSVTGNFRWEGIILITGQYVGLRYGGGGNQTIYGGVVVNETANVNTEVEVDAAGNPKVLYSCQALNNVRNMRQMFRLASWREL